MKQNYFLSKILVTILIFVASFANAQSDIGVTININPPYTPRITEYVETPGKMLLIIRNNTNQVKNIYLGGSIKGDNGVTMFNDPNAKPSSPLVLQPFQVYTANNYNLQEVFSVEKYTMTGITKREVIRKNGLPEGNYDICVRAYDFATGLPLSGDAPQGCKYISLADLEPPYPIKPLADEIIKGQEPQTVIFSWTIPAGAEPGTQYKLRIVEMLNPAKNINDAYLSNTTPVFFETIVPANVFVYGLAQPKLVLGRKYAWAVTAIPGPKLRAYKNNGRSEIRSFTFGNMADNSKPIITLNYPANNAIIKSKGSNATIDFEFKWSFTNPQKNYYNEDIKMFEIADGQTKEQAILGPKNCMSSREPNGSAKFGNFCGKAEGKKYAWYVSLYDGGGKETRSEIYTFSIEKNESTPSTFSQFELCGFPIKVSSLTHKGGYQYSGTGTTTLGKGGKEFTISFWDLTIQPFGSISKPGTSQVTLTDWKAVKSNYQNPVKTNFKYWTHIDYNLPKDIGGTLWYDAKNITFTPYIESEFLTDKNYFTLKEISPYQKVIMEGTFRWETPIITFKDGNQQEVLIFKSTGISQIDYNNLFDSTAANYMVYTKPDGTQNNKNFWLWMNGKVLLELNPKLSITNKGKTPKFEFTGNYTIKSPKTDKPDLTVGINHNALIFTQKIKPYTTNLNKDKSATCSFDSVQIDLVNKSERVKIPNLNLNIKFNNNNFAFNFKKAQFASSNGLYCDDTSISSNDLTISGFPVSIKKSKVILNKTTLFSFYCTGNLQVPFINQNAAVAFNVTEDGVQSTYVDFEENKEVVLYQNLDGDKCTMKPSSGFLKSDRIEMGGKLSLTNTKKPNDGINIKDISMPRIFIKPDGEVGQASQFAAGNQVPYQTAGEYKGFKFSPFTINLFREANKKYKLNIKGMVVLADNLASDTKTSNFGASIVFDKTNNPGGGPPPNQDVSISSDEVQGGCTNSVVDFGMKFKYFNGDATFGKGFMAEGNFGMQQPNPMKVHAKMIVAKAPQNFNYWYFEAGQENVMTIPTGLLDLSIYGFTGRVYYKMKHSGTNINTDDYVPNSSSFIGVYGLTQLKTLTDNGVKFWGSVALEVATASYGLESIKFRGGGEFVSSGVGNEGLVRAKDCQLEFYWKPKRIYANFNLSVDLMSALTADANAGLDITGKDFHLWANGTGYLFGSKDFSGGDFGLDCTNKDINVWGNYNLINIDKSIDLGICEPSILVKSGLWVDAYVNYSPFKFKGQGVLYGTIRVAGCRLKKTFSVSLGAQVMLPSPTCVSISYKIKTPLKDFTLSAGFKTPAKLFFGTCF